MKKTVFQSKARMLARQEDVVKTPRALTFVVTFAFIFMMAALLAGCDDETSDYPEISSFTASAESIEEGDSAQLTAIFRNGSGSIDNGIGAVASGAPKTITPTETTTYTLTVTSSKLVQITLKVTISVKPKLVPQPEIVSFKSSVAALVEGDGAVLTAVFNNGSGSIDKGVGAVASGEPTRVSPTETTTFTLTVTNSEGVEETRAVTVTVEPRFAARPEIVTFEASSVNIVEGDSPELTAIFSNGTGSIDNGIGAIVSGEPVVISPEEKTIYTLTVTNIEGVKVTSIVTITVEPHPIALTIASPTHNQLFYSVMRVAAAVRSQTGLDTITLTATLSGVSTPLLWSPEAVCDGGDYCDQGFDGHIPLGGVPPGDHVLTVTAVDELGRSISKQREIRVKEPFITITEPLPLTVASPELPLEIACFKDVSDCVISVSVQSGSMRVSAVGSLSETLDLSAYNGRRVTVNITARDGVNPALQVSRSIFVEVSENLERVKQFDGQIADFDGQKALILMPDVNVDKLEIHDVESNDFAVVEVPDGSTILPRHSYLTPTGAIYLARPKDRSEGETVYDWNKSVLHDFERPISPSSLAVVGDYASWSDNSNVWLRHFQGETNVPVVSSSGNYAATVFENGAVVYVSLSPVRAIKKYEAGIETTLVESHEIYGTPAAEGDRLVFVRREGVPQRSATLVYHDGTDETILAEFTNTSPSRGTGYQINNGWVAFIKLDSSGQRHVWTRDPNGILLQRTFFESHSYLDYLSTDGEVMLANSGRRYISDATGNFTEVSSAASWATSTKIDGVWYLYLGRSLFKVK